MKTGIRRQQRGAALLAILAVIMLAAASLLITRLNTTSGGINAARTARNSDVLQRAKLALIGYVAAQAAKGYPIGEDNPGALPCPEHAWYIDQPTKEGGAGPSIGVSNPGYGTANCSSIGRFPWRTIGTEKFVDTSGEPLWYVVGPTWRKTSASTKTVINSNTTGDLTVDGQPIVALIIAPGPAMRVQAGTTTAGAACSARNQARSAPAGTMDPLDYLECYSAATLQFSTTGPSASFNDQVVQVTAADLLPGIEAAIANRIEREIAPLLNTVYSANASWGNLTTLLPMANTFSVASSNVNAYAGTPAMQGLLPLSYAETSAGSGTPCTPSGSAPNYCEPNFVKWSGTPTISNIGGVSTNATTTAATSCSISTSTTTTINCTVYGYGSAFSALPSVTLRLQATANNAGAALRTFNTSTVIHAIGGSGTGINSGYTATATLNSSGDATVTLDGTSPSSNGTTVSDATCGLSGFINTIFFNCFKYTLSVPIFLLADHANIHKLFDSADPDYDTYQWFVRNQWHLLSYYAIASAVGPGGSGACVTSTTCLQVTHHSSDGKQRAVLLLAGQAISGQDRNSSTLSNWFEGANADGVSPFELRSTTLLTNRTFNDRVSVISTN